MALVLAALAALVLWRPLTRASTHVLGPWDTLSQSSSLTHVTTGERVANTQLSDPVLQMAPWMRFAVDEAEHGRVALWNPFNGCGIPLLANYQNGALSPLNAAHYALEHPSAALIAALLKLWIAALAMHALLRALGRTHVASLVGAFVYGFAGFHLVTLLHPHGWTTALAPLGLACVERAIQRVEQRAEGGVRGTWGWLAGAALALGLAALSGHPETLAASAVIVLAWSVVRGAALWRREAEARPALLRLAAALGLTALLAVAVAAVQILPFLEYLRVSADTVALARGQRLELRDLAFQLAPDLAGSPRAGDQLSPVTPSPSYQDSAAHFVGPLALALALLAVLSKRARQEHRFWIGLAALHAVLVLDGSPVGVALRRWTLFDALPPLRLQPWLLFPSAILAAAAIDARRAGDDARLSRQVFALSMALGAAVSLVAWRALALREELDLDWARLGELALASTARIWTGVALGLLGWILLRSRPAVGAGLLLVGQALGPAAGLADYVPTVDREHVAPTNERLERLRARVRDERILFLTTDDIRPNANLLYGLRTPMSYDALEVAPLARMRERAFGPQGYRGVATKASVRALQLFGVRYASTRGAWAPVGSEFALGIDSSTALEPYLRHEYAQRPSSALRPVEAGAAGVQQRFSVARDGLDGLALRVLPPSGPVEGALEATLRVVGGPSIASERRELRSLRRLGARELELVMRFDPRGDSSRMTYELEVTASGSAGDSVSLVRLSAPTRGEAPGEREARPPERARTDGWELRSAGASLRGRIVADLSCNSPLRPLEDLGSQTLFEYAASRGRAWVVHRASVAASDQEAFERVWSDDFDPYSEVVLQVPSTTSTSAPGVEQRSHARFVREDSRSSTWRVEAAAAGIVVLAHTHFPGWRAYLDGVERPLLRANHAFCAVETPAGEHELELRFEPASFRWGAALSLGAALLALGLAIASVRRW